MMTLVPQKPTKIPQGTTSDRLVWFPDAIISRGMLPVPTTLAVVGGRAESYVMKKLTLIPHMPIKIPHRRSQPP